MPPLAPITNKNPGAIAFATGAIRKVVGNVIHNNFPVAAQART
jgi:hypothetical protein